MCSALGHDVVEAGSAEEALRLLNRGLTPDFVVTDHLMPGMSGTELARAALQTILDGRICGCPWLWLAGSLTDALRKLPRLANGGCETGAMPSAAAAYGVGDLRSPRPHWLGCAGGGVALGLMFHLRVDLRTEQDDDGGDPQPSHEADDRPK